MRHIIVVFLLVAFINNDVYSQIPSFTLLKQKLESNKSFLSLKVDNIDASYLNFQVQVFQNDLDSALIFNCDYSLIDKDPSCFYSIEISDTQLLFGVGIFDFDNFLLHITTTQSDGSIRNFSVN